MNSCLLKKIEQSINSNLKRTAINYYSDNHWVSYTYSEVEYFSKLVKETLEETVHEKWTYVLLYLKVTPIFPVVLLGILKASLGFICVEEGDNELLNYYINNMKVKYVYTTRDVHEDKSFLPCDFLFRRNIIIFGTNLSLWESQVDCSFVSEKEFLYCIKTSGTTGLSKTVHVPECCIFPNIRDLSEVLKVNQNDVILYSTPVTFDPSVVELFLAFCNGCSLCILEKQYKDDPQKTADLLFSQKSQCVTILQTTPSLLRRWSTTDLREKILHKSSSLRSLVLGGEEFPNVDEIESWEVPPHISVYNIYGVTEVSCWASVNKIFPSKSISTHIGKPLSETFYELKNPDSNNEGELLIGSYTRKCLVGAEKISDIFVDEHMLFRSTGDIFKTIDGELFFIGRKDDVIKRWGSRASLSEIERTIREHENTAQCASVVVKHESHSTLCVFLVQKFPKPLKGLKMYLREHLPQTAWPDLIKILSALPLTNHGKVNKTSLKSLYSNFENDKTQYFNELWETYTTDPSGDRNFLSTGGNSFSALQLFNELRLKFPEIPESFLGTLLQSKTKNELEMILNGSKHSDMSLISSQKNNEQFQFSQKYLRGDSYEKAAITYLKGRKISCTYEASREVADYLNVKLCEDWKHNLGKCVDASPLGIKLSNDQNLVIIGSHSGKVVVLDIDNSKVLSECSLPDRIESSACVYDLANIYYIGCYDGCLYCIETKSGDIRWKYQTNDIVKSTPVVYGGKIIFGSYDTYLYSINDNASLNWKKKLKSPILTEVIIDGNTLYSATLGSIGVLNVETGQIIMEIDSLPVFSTPVLSSGALVVANVKGKVVWFNMESGQEVHSFLAEDMVFSSMVKLHWNGDNEILLFGCNDANIYCLKDKKLFWKTQLDSKIVSTPFVEIINSTDFKGFVLCFSSAGKGYALDIASGKILCEYSLPGEVFSSPIIMDSKAIVGCRDDNVYVLKLVMGNYR